jgi:hypothetical protein
MVKRERTSRSGQVMFSKEAGNIMSVNTFKYSGIANKKNIDVAASGQTLTTNVSYFIIFIYICINNIM